VRGDTYLVGELAHWLVQDVLAHEPLHHALEHAVVVILRASAGATKPSRGAVEGIRIESERGKEGCERILGLSPHGRWGRECQLG
jgi:hypothetical protein